VLIAGLARHTRVAVAQELEPVHAKDLARATQLLRPDLAQARPDRGLVHVVDLALFPSGAGHQHHPVAVQVGPQHDSARRDALVVGMGMNQEQRCHYPISSSTRLAMPPVPGLPTVLPPAAARTSGAAPSTA